MHLVSVSVSVVQRMGEVGSAIAIVVFFVFFFELFALLTGQVGEVGRIRRARGVGGGGCGAFEVDAVCEGTEGGSLAMFTSKLRLLEQVFSKMAGWMDAVDGCGT